MATTKMQRNIVYKKKKKETHTLTHTPPNVDRMNSSKVRTNIFEFEIVITIFKSK